MEETPRKKILIHTDYANQATGFGGHCQRLMKYLYRTNKYTIANFAAGVPDNPDFQRFPWKTYGGLPNKPEDIQSLQQKLQSEQNPHRRAEMERDNNYGEHLIDKVIQDFKPDIYLGINDIWGVDFNLNKKWWNKLSCIIHWTADSLPLQEKAVERAEEIKYHYTWAEFAVKEFRRLAAKLDPVKDAKKIEAFNRVKCIPGTIDSSRFCKKSDAERAALRAKYNIDSDTFCVGMLSRNQLRKFFGCALEGFKKFQEQNPKVKAKLLLFTSYREGWSIKRFMEEFGIKNEDVLAAYKCRKTGEMFILPYTGEDLDNPITGDKKSLLTVGVDCPLAEEKIVEWYNLLDAFTLPISSGAAEYGNLQAKLCELITIINGYSCFEDQVVPEAASLEMDWTTTREIGTNFIKAAPSAWSLAKQLTKVYEMDRRKRSEMGKKAREWTINRFDTEVVGKQFEELFDSLPYCDWDFNMAERPANLNAQAPSNFSSVEALIKFAYKDILNWEEDKISMERPDFKDWKEKLEKGFNPQEFLKIIQSAGAEHNKKMPVVITPEQHLRNLGVKEDAVLIVFKESGGDIVGVLSLLKSLREQYNGRQLVISCDEKFRELLEGSEYIDLIIQFQPFMDNQLLLQGAGANKALVYKSIHLRNGTQICLDYLGPDNLNLDLKYNN